MNPRTQMLYPIQMAVRQLGTKVVRAFEGAGGSSSPRMFCSGGPAAQVSNRATAAGVQSKVVRAGSSPRMFCSGTPTQTSQGLEGYSPIVKGFAGVTVGLACLIPTMYWSSNKLVNFVNHLTFVIAYEAMAPKREAIKKDRAARRARMKALRKECRERQS